MKEVCEVEDGRFYVSYWYSSLYNCKIVLVFQMHDDCDITIFSRTMIDDFKINLRGYSKTGTFFMENSMRIFVLSDEEFNKHILMEFI